MARGIFTTKQKPREEQFAAVNDQKLQMTLSLMADRYSEAIRSLIYQTYQDNELAAIYRAIRSSGVYQKGGKTKVHRKVFEFPNPFVYDFCDTVMTNLHGPDWLQNKRTWRHELLRPWAVVERL